MKPDNVRMNLFVFAWCAFFAGHNAARDEWPMAVLLVALGLIMYSFIIDSIQRTVARELGKHLKEVGEALIGLAKQLNSLRLKAERAPMKDA